MDGYLVYFQSILQKHLLTSGKIQRRLPHIGFTTQYIYKTFTEISEYKVIHKTVFTVYTVS